MFVLQIKWQYDLSIFLFQYLLEMAEELGAGIKISADGKTSNFEIPDWDLYGKERCWDS